MNALLNGLKQATDVHYTENGALSHSSTYNKVYDLFAFGGAYRHRNDEDCIFLFKQAFDEDPVYALKCLFYLRDVRGGQGERRLFRVCMKWLAKQNTEAARRNINYISEFGRWDDLYLFIGTPLQNDALQIMKDQLALDVQSKTPSLLAKWLCSENTSSAESCALGNITRAYFGMTHKQYRKTLSILRERIKVLERLMSANRWDEIEFDKIPSKAGLKYKNAFAVRDITKARYEAFAKDETKKVNAKTLYPYEVVAEVIKNDYSTGYWYGHRSQQLAMDDPQRLMINKYWDNLTDYINGAAFNGIAVVDTSASMVSREASAPINVAISLGLYCAEKNNGPFKNHYISFSSRPQLIETDGVDFYDKVRRIYDTNLCQNTNLTATFDLILDTALKNGLSQDEIPQNVIVISDMEIDCGANFDGRSTYYGCRHNDTNYVVTEMEAMRDKWATYGYKMPHLIYWNVDARQNNILDSGENVSYVSGMSPVLYEQIMQGKSGIDLMLDKLNSERYAVIQ